MAMRAATVMCLALTAAIPCLAQSGQSDSQTLQAILAEIRAIHQEVKVTQTSQILLTELQVQQTVVNRATQRVDDAQSRLNDIKLAQKENAGEQARIKERLEQPISDPNEAQALTEHAEELKRQAATMATIEQERTTNLQSAQQQLKDAQDSLDEIQSQLNAIVKQMTPARN
ncbi:MAG TPA: hypothetical protein VHE33_17665 [Acidobacteriaceae bacterium]|nr:hypothetical protein [Acidobacteriaceae bacterium]